MASTAMRHTEQLVNGIRLHCVESGPDDGPLVVLLHGFPEYWASWDRQIAPLAEAGHRVVVPDLRGYNTSEKPSGVESYTVSTLVADVAELIHALGAERADVVSHDWGGIIAWALAITRPDVVSKLVVMNAPHPAAFRRERRNPEQLKRSWYVGFFQLPWLPERFVVRFGRAALKGAKPGSYSPAEIQAHAAAWRQPGARTAMLNYYRALIRKGNVQGSQVAAPTLVLWGDDDTALVPELADHLEQWAPDVRVVHYPQATHWVMRDEADAVNREIVDFLRAQ